MKLKNITGHADNSCMPYVLSKKETINICLSSYETLRYQQETDNFLSATLQHIDVIRDKCKVV